MIYSGFISLKDYSTCKQNIFRQRQNSKESKLSGKGNDNDKDWDCNNNENNNNYNNNRPVSQENSPRDDSSFLNLFFSC